MKKEDYKFTITEFEVWEVSELTDLDGPLTIDTLKKKYKSFQNTQQK